MTTPLRCYNCETKVNVELRSITWTGLYTPLELTSCPYCWQATIAYADRRTELGGRKERPLLDSPTAEELEATRLRWEEKDRIAAEKRERQYQERLRAEEASRVALTEARLLKAAEEWEARLAKNTKLARQVKINRLKREYINRERRSFLDFDSMHGNQSSELVEQEMSSIMAAYRQDHPTLSSDEFPYHDEFEGLDSYSHSTWRPRNLTNSPP